MHTKTEVGFWFGMSSSGNIVLRIGRTLVVMKKDSEKRDTEDFRSVLSQKQPSSIARLNMSQLTLTYCREPLI
ncbi:hypothetical protein XELAEV_18043855mg [Xenopus laevis]|uniref:Uncharacterized protein n=1 Tax=Xenopus laevis TaxID=8355 RepID=A0A974H2Q9_XENLA|nr:hypothetical protein XELAEV_18043855mg [Xenopus laevis]